MTTESIPTDITQLLSDIAVQAATGNYRHADDTAFFASGRIDDAEVRERILIERLVIRTAVASIIDEGKSVTVYHEDEQSDAVRSRDIDAIMAEVGACDCETLAVFTPGILGRFGWVRLIHGNDGWDVMQDYTTNLGLILNKADTLANDISEAL